MKYENPTIKVTMFEIEDVVTGSNDQGIDTTTAAGKAQQALNSEKATRIMSFNY